MRVLYQVPISLVLKWSVCHEQYLKGPFLDRNKLPLLHLIRLNYRFLDLNQMVTIDVPNLLFPMARNVALPPNSRAISPRFVYHPVMLNAAKLSVKAIILLVLSIIILISVFCCGCYFACWRCRARKRKEARKITALKTIQGEEETRRRWDQIFGRKRKDELELQSLGCSSKWSEVDLGLPKPKSARVREWKMWDMP
jgi:hypothetical protein